MNFMRTEIEDLIVIEPKVYTDDRGYFYENYKKLEYDKKMYVVSNINKSFILAGITPIAGTILYDSLYTGSWNNNLIKNMLLYLISIS